MSAAAPPLVLGAGPAGLAVAAALRARAAPATVLDRRGAVGGAYRDIPADLAMASPARFTALGRGPDVLDDRARETVLAGEYLGYLLRFASAHEIEPSRGEVTRLDRARDGSWLARVRGENCDPRTIEARAVVIATGMWDTPRWPTVPGLAPRAQGPCVQHSRDFRRASPGERVLVVGAGTSAVEVAERSVRDGASVLVSARGERVRTVPKSLFGRDLHEYSTVFERLPRWLARSFCRDRPTILPTDLGFSGFVRDGRARVRGPLRALDGDRAVFERGPAERVDRVVCATGFRYALPFAPEGLARMDRAEELPATGERGESASHAGLFFLGFPCAIGVASEFLRGIARDAPRVADALR